MILGLRRGVVDDVCKQVFDEVAEVVGRWGVGLAGGVGSVFEGVAADDGEGKRDEQGEQFGVDGFQVGDGEGEQANDENGQGDEDAAGFERQEQRVDERAAGGFVGEQVIHGRLL